MRNYQTAVESLEDREVELRKRALYRAGILAAALKDKDGAVKFLSNLAEIDFGYRDVAERLKKLNVEHLSQSFFWLAILETVRLTMFS